MSLPVEIQRWFGESLFESVPVNIAVIDRGLHVVLANRSFEQLFGEWHGRQCWEVYKHRERKCRICPADVAFQQGRMQVREESGLDREGAAAQYLVQVVPIRQEDGSIPYCVEMSTDITGLRRLEQEVLEAERLAAMGQTVAGLAHGIKNIITGLEGGLYVLRSGLKKGRQDRLESGWEMLERNVGRISTLSKGLLSFSRGVELDAKATDPVGLAAEVAALYRDAAAREGIAIAVEVPHPVRVVALDVAQMHDALTNLVSNAVDACKMSERQRGQVTLRVLTEPEALVFEVEDDGVGMDAEVKRKLFTTFFTTKGQSGTGIGMLQVRKIAHAHGGRVTATSEPGQGSRLRLVLPWERLPRPLPSEGEPSPPGVASPPSPDVYDGREDPGAASAPEGEREP